MNVTIRDEDTGMLITYHNVTDVDDNNTIHFGIDNCKLELLSTETIVEQVNVDMRLTQISVEHALTLLSEDEEPFIYALEKAHPDKPLKYITNDSTMSPKGYTKHLYYRRL